jgi:hypothetical protein
MNRLTLGTAQYRSWWPVATLVATALATTRPAEGQGSDSEHLRPMSVTVTIENDRLYSGTYTASGIATVCGRVTLGYPDRARSFTIEFPDADNTGLKVQSVSFDAKDLAPGTSTGSFHLNVGVLVGERGTPPLYVVRADQPEYNEPGNAQLVNDTGGMTLTLTGTAALGVRLRVKATCRPKS